MRRALRLLLPLFLLVALIAFLPGGGFGPKSNGATLNAVPFALFAHRAGNGALPENCVEGVARSLEAGYTGVELDIHETRDHVFVLFHDDACDRLLGQPGLTAEKDWSAIAPLTLRNHGEPTDIHPARLDSVLARFGDRLLFYLDTKFTGSDRADSIAALVERYHCERNTLIASSSIPFITRLEYLHPGLNTVLEGFDKGEEWTWHLFPKNLRPDFVSSFAFETDSAQVDWLRSHDLLANKLVYGVDSAAYARLRGQGITRFIVDEGVPVIGR